MNWADRITAAQKRGTFTAADRKKAAQSDLRGVIAPGYLPEGREGLRAELLGFTLADAVRTGHPAIARAAEIRLRAIVGPGGVL